MNRLKSQLTHALPDSRKTAASRLLVRSQKTVLVSLMATIIVIQCFAAAHAKTSDNTVGVSQEMCTPFERSPIYRPPARVLNAHPENWVEVINNAVKGDEVQLKDGTYTLTQYAVVLDKSITLRGASGNRDNVIIQGQGLSVNAEALMIMADEVHIADLTIKDVRDHAISIQEGFVSPVIYNVHLKDIGTQHIKSNRGGHNGLIACSSIGYTNDTGVGDYNGAIDLHGAVEWTIRDNYIYNIWGDGSRCIVDAECGTQFFGGGPAILIWNNSRDNIIERNTIVESFRAIALGLDTEYSGGVVRNNYICRTQPGKQGVKKYIKGDAGISLRGVANVDVNNNRVLINGRYRGAIELKYSSGISIENNVTSKKIWNKGRSDYNGCRWWFCDDEGFGNTVTNSPVSSCP